jgi:hypothetical protein
MHVYRRHFLRETKVSINKRGQATFFYFLVMQEWVCVKGTGLLFLVGVILCKNKRCQTSIQKMLRVFLPEEKVACSLCSVIR